MNTIADQFLECHKLILLLQRNFRQLRLNATFHIHSVVSNLLPIVATLPEPITAGRLVTFLQETKVQVSRFLNRLERNAYIKSEQNIFDRRERLLKISVRGRLALRQMVNLDNQLADKVLNSLSNKERQLIVDFFAALADGLGAPKVEALDREDIFVVEQKRLARSLGMHGSNYMESGFSIGEYQLLYELSEFRDGLPTKQLIRATSLDPSTLWRTLRELSKRELMSDINPDMSKRERLWRLTPTGRRYFKEVHEKCTKQIFAGMNNQSLTMISKACSAMAQAIKSVALSTPNQLKVKICKSDHDFAFARGELIEIFLANDAHHRLSHLLLPPERKCGIIRDQRNTLCVWSVSRKADLIIIETFALLPSILGTPAERACINKFMQAIGQEDTKYLRISSEMNYKFRARLQRFFDRN